MSLHPTLKITLRILKYVFLSLVLLFLLLVGAINLPVVHRGLTSTINSIFQDKGIPVNAGKISLLLTGEIGLGQIAIIKESGDTIVYAGNVNISVSPIQLLFRKLVINNANIQDVVVNLQKDKKTIMVQYPSVPGLFSHFYYLADGF